MRTRIPGTTRKITWFRSNSAGIRPIRRIFGQSHTRVRYLTEALDLRTRWNAICTGRCANAGSISKKHNGKPQPTGTAFTSRTCDPKTRDIPMLDEGVWAESKLGASV